MKKLILLLALSLLNISCSSTKSNESTQTNSNILNNQKWILVELYGKKISSDNKDNPYFISFSEIGNQYSAWVGCNRIGGEFNVDNNNRIKFSKSRATMMACADMTVEQRFISMLEQVDNLSISENSMTLNKARMTPLARFEKLNASNQSSLLDGNWEVEYIGTPGTIMDEHFPNKKPTLSININSNEASGNGSCNNYNTSFRVSGNNINFKYPAATKMACKGNGESIYFKTLESVNKFSVNQNTLTLITDDIVMLRLKRI